MARYGRNDMTDLVLWCGSMQQNVCGYLKGRKEAKRKDLALVEKFERMN